MEEALAETIALVRVQGAGSILTGLRFPAKNGYVTVAQMGQDVKGILMFPLNVDGNTYRVFFSEGES